MQLRNKSAPDVRVKNKRNGKDFKNPKEKNFVFQQLMKIEKIDREIEKKTKEA